MRNPIRVATALWALFVLLSRTRFRRGGRYWRWRDETAFGLDPTRRPSAAERRGAMLDYGEWVHRMKRL
ncbi:MAG TPA: hypothetical protein PKC43_08195 [Phycisphaerales bacterium]|nr:hypothetical protein [Phycisphaerales bacterium]HMP37417.1 hypothetical protein [Phycisphaerales bacterium]